MNADETTALCALVAAALGGTFLELSRIQRQTPFYMTVNADGSLPQPMGLARLGGALDALCEGAADELAMVERAPGYGPGYVYRPTGKGKEAVARRVIEGDGERRR